VDPLGVGPSSHVRKDRRRVVGVPRKGRRLRRIRHDVDVLERRVVMHEKGVRLVFSEVMELVKTMDLLFELLLNLFDVLKRDILCLEKERVNRRGNEFGLAPESRLSRRKRVSYKKRGTTSTSNSQPGTPRQSRDPERTLQPPPRHYLRNQARRVQPRHADRAWQDRLRSSHRAQG
jgi:hypothetical protein